MIQFLKSNKIILAIAILLLITNTSQGKRLCYVCDTVTHTDACFWDPESLNATIQKPCKHFCTIQRDEFTNIPNTVLIRFVRRDCEKNPSVFDGVIADLNFTISYFRSCRANLCNGGDGLKSLKDIPPEEDEDEEEITNGSYTNYQSTSILISKIYFFAYVASTFSIT